MILSMPALVEPNLLFFSVSVDVKRCSSNEGYISVYCFVTKSLIIIAGLDAFLMIIIAGLDAFQAEKVMETLRQLAQDGHTVICSIHQPRSSVYGKFDDIVLLTEGAIVYAGPALDEPLAYFSRFGL